MKILAALLVLMFSSTVQAETTTLAAEGSYIMGDGETPTFAEAMALQKAKQMALEEAGTYVQSYTKSVNQDLTKDEIQTLAGGVVQVEVLEKTRSLVADGLRFYTKIKATVTTDRMEELVRRIKGKNVAEEYVQLQAEYARLSRELEDWKQRAARIPKGPKHAAALDRIQDDAKAFVQVQEREANLFQRLVSGKQLVESVSRDKEVIDDLLKTIEERGFVVKVGEIKAVALDGGKDTLAVNVPLTIRVSDSLLTAVSNATGSLGGSIRSDVMASFPDNQQHPQTVRIGKDAHSEVAVTLVRLGRYLETARSFQDRIMKLALLVTFEGPKAQSRQERTLVQKDAVEKWADSVSGMDDALNEALEYLVSEEDQSELDKVTASRSALSGEDRDKLYQCYLGYTEDSWLAVRRMFPVFEVVVSDSSYVRGKIDNGWYDKSHICKVAKTKGGLCRFTFTELPDAREGMQEIPGRDGYVAIVRDEASFVARMNLHTDAVKKVTGVRVRVVPRNQLPQYSRHCDIVQ